MKVTNNPNSLVGKIMKGKYFKTGTILSAKLGHGPSQISRSIWESRSLTKESMRLRVKNGQKNKILSDKWLPTLTTHLVQSQVKIFSSEATAKELIDNRGCWNTNLIHDVMNEEEVAMISSLLVSRRGSEDKIIWGSNKSAIFSVKTTYHSLDHMKRRLEGKQSTSTNRIGWKKTWELKVPNFVKKFLWKAVSEVLPTKWNLFWRKIIENDLCPIYKLCEETSCHTLWSCGAASDVWAEDLSSLQK